MKRPPLIDLWDYIPRKRFCHIGYHKNEAQTITMTLKKALHPTNSNKVISKLNIMVPYISSVTKITSYFLNWYANEYKQLFPFPPKNARNLIELMIKMILGQSKRIRPLTFKTYPYLFEPLERFLILFPNFQLDCPIEIHQSMMNLAGETLITNLDLYHLQFLDFDYLMNQLIKYIIFNIRENIKDPKEQKQVIKDTLTPSYKKEISQIITLKLKEIKKLHKPTLKEKYTMMEWLYSCKQYYDPNLKMRHGYFYPLCRFKDNMISIDLKSFMNVMNCTFSQAFLKHVIPKEKQPGHSLLTTSIRTDGYSIQFIKRITDEVPLYKVSFLDFKFKNKEEKEKYKTFFKQENPIIQKNIDFKGVWIKNTKDIQRGKRSFEFDLDNAIDKPTFDLIKTFTSLPKEKGTRVLTQVLKEPDNQIRLNYLGKCTLDPGKKQIYTVLNNENQKTVAMSKERQSHLRLTGIFTKIEINNRTKLGNIITELSTCCLFNQYIQKVHVHFKTLRNHYSTKTCKKLRFKRAQIEQKIMDLMYKEIQHGEILATNMKWNDKKRKKIKYKKVIEKRKNVIYYGDGSFKHNTKGCRSVMNKKLVYELSKRALVIMIPEFRTSKTCCNCFHLNENNEWHTIVKANNSKLRLRQCTHCLVSLDRDVNAVFNMLNVVEHYIKFNEKPFWQNRS